jgi:hypothetical protein
MIENENSTTISIHIGSLLHTGRIGAAKHIQRTGRAVESSHAVGACGRAQRQTLPVNYLC